jgi:hypothetical protein
MLIRMRSSDNLDSVEVWSRSKSEYYPRLDGKSRVPLMRDDINILAIIMLIFQPNIIRRNNDGV